MIPTWTDHAHEARKYVRFAPRTAIVRALRYVAHLSATFQEGHPSPAQEPPMTTLKERHEADQDDADRYAQRTVIWPIDIAELTAEIERLTAEHDEMREAIAERIVLVTQNDELRAALTRVEELTDGLITNENAIGTHWASCYKHHRDCLVQAIRATLKPLYVDTEPTP